MFPDADSNVFVSFRLSLGLRQGEQMGKENEVRSFCDDDQFGANTGRMRAYTQPNQRA
jgi:hypothetical protein